MFNSRPLAAPAADPLPPVVIRNVAVLSAAMALMGANFMVHIALGPLAAALIAPSQAWVTAPITVAILTNALVAAPLSFLMARIGRRTGFILGAFCAAAAGGVSAYAIVIGSFWLFLAGSVGFGIYQAGQNLYRFAAADASPEAFKPKAISYVLAGGLAAAFIGPAIARNFSDLLAPTQIAGAYLALVGLNMIGAIPLAFLNMPRAKARAESRAAAPRRPLVVALSEPGVAVAILCGMVSYGTMTFVMTSTSSAMVGCGHGMTDAVSVISAHVVAMFAPSFFTGSLIARFGHRAIILTGFALMAVSAMVAQTGLGLAEFSVSLVLLGLGWNFGFIGSSSLLAARYREEDKASVQAVNESCVFGLMAVASLASGALLGMFGWSIVNIATLPMLLTAALALLTDRSRGRKLPA